MGYGLRILFLCPDKWQENAKSPVWDLICGGLKALVLSLMQVNIVKLQIISENWHLCLILHSIPQSILEMQNNQIIKNGCIEEHEIKALALQRYRWFVKNLSNPKLKLSTKYSLLSYSLSHNCLEVPEHLVISVSYQFEMHNKNN